MSTQISVNTRNLAIIVLNGENFFKKIQNTIAYLEAEYAGIQSDSPQIREFKKNMDKEMADMDNIKAMVNTMMKGLEDRRKQIDSLENSAEIWAAARASMTESQKQGRVKV